VNYILFNVIIIFAGFIAILIFSIGLMACLAPMALFAKSENPPEAFMLPLMGIAGIYQVYFWGFWSAFCVAVTITFTHKPEVTWDWLYWITGFIDSASLIGWLAHKERQGSQSLKEARRIGKGTTFYFLIAIVAFLVFAFAPSLMLPPYAWALKPLGLQRHSAFPAEFMDDRANFVQSITVLGESSDLINKPSNNSDEAYTIPKATEQQVYSKIEEGLALSKIVDNAFLDYIHPDLKNYYRNKLIAGTEIYYEGIKSNNSGNISLGVQRQIEGNNLMTEWVNWWNSHNKDLANKGYPKD